MAWLKKHKPAAPPADGATAPQASPRKRGRVWRWLRRGLLLLGLLLLRLLWLFRHL